MTDGELTELTQQLDTLLQQHRNCPSHELAGVLLSRVTLLMATDAQVGKELLKWVWQQLDQIEQARPTTWF